MKRSEASSTEPLHTRDRRKSVPWQPAASPTVAVFLGDSLAILTALLATALLVDSETLPTEASLPSLAYWPLNLALIVAWQTSIAATGAYTRRILGGMRIPIRRIMTGTLFAFGVCAIVDITVLHAVPAAVFSLTLPLGIILLFAIRLIIKGITIGRSPKNRPARAHMMLCAEGECETTLHFLAQRDREDGVIVGRILAQEALNSPSPIDFILDRLLKNNVGTLLVTPHSGLSPQQAQALRWALEGSDIKLSFLLPVHGVSQHRMNVRAGLKAAIIDITPGHYTGWYFHTKRLWDIILSSIGIIALTPMWIIVSLIIKLSDGGPVVFAQTRVGLHGRHFKMLKFRTMRPDAETVLQDMVDTPELTQDSGNEILFKLKEDPRITRVGRFLRRYSIDELPQLFNILRGDMCLIGPRPPLPSEVAQYDPQVLRKFLIKPGLTGLWQTMGRSNLSWEDSVMLDLYYTENCSPALDFWIFARTFKIVFSGDGAY